MSTNRKTAIRFFDVMDYEKEAEYLSKMHARGWKFVHVGFPCVYHFVGCEPEQVRYQLDYNQDGVKNKEAYTQMFADLGWEYLFDFVGYSYFRKPVGDGALEEDEDIFCDEDSRWDMIKRIFRGRIIPLIVIFLAVLMPACIRVAHLAQESGSDRVVLGIMLVMVVLYLWIFLRFTIKYLAFKRRLGR